MTIIAAKQFWKTNEDKKWTLFTDDCVTIWQSQISAARKYRPKLREITWKNFDLIVASCWGTREVDLLLNLLEAKLEITKVKNTMDLGVVIQTILIEAWKTLWDIAKDPSIWLLILEVGSNTLWKVDDYSMFRVPDEVEVVDGSWEQAFFSANKYENFLWSLRLAVKTDEYCEFPIYAYRNGEMFSFYVYQDNYEMEQTLLGNPPSHDCQPICCNAEYTEPSWINEWTSAKL